jgi:demethylspheroidene O-methyltransferase
VSWIDRYLAVRDRWLTNPKFQRWAAAFPLTRPTARRRARALFDVCAGFVYSQILFACVRLKLFDLLAKGPLTAAELAARLNVPLDSTERLLEAAVSLRLVEHRPAGRFGLGTLGAAMVGNPAVGAMVEHHSLLYADLHDPVGLLRRESRDTALAKYWTYSAAVAPASEPTAAGPAAAEPPTSEPPTAGALAAGPPTAGAPAAVNGSRLVESRGGDYTSLMSNSQALVSHEILDAYPLTKHRRLLDVGGGDGSFLIEAGRRYEHLHLTLFDLPPVAERAAQRFESLGLKQRSQAIGGDFLSQPLPGGSDIVSLVRVVHDHDDEAAMTLLRSAHRALPPKGVLLLAEPMMGTRGAEPVADAYFGFYLLAMGRGRPRTPQNLQQMLAAAGFTDTHLVRTRQPLQSRLLVARKGKSAESSVILN